MAKIIPLPIRPVRLPRRLLNDGWWLESTQARPTLLAFPPPNPSKPKTGPNPKRRHLTLVIPEK
jgi:hypothetical protein